MTPFIENSGRGKITPFMVLFVRTVVAYEVLRSTGKEH